MASGGIQKGQVMKLRIADRFSLPIDAVTQTFGILAKRGVGKTYTASVMAEEMLNNGQQIVAIDPTGAWWGLRSHFKIVIVGGEHGDVPLEETAGETIAQAIVENGFSCVIDTSLFRKGQEMRFMVNFAETIYRLNRAALHLFVDEADRYAPQQKNYGGDELKMLGAMEDIVRRGRKRGIGCTLITQRPSVLNKNVLTQCEVLVSLRLVHPRDIGAIKEWVDVHADPQQARDMIASLPSLPIGTAWFWSPGWGDFFERVKIRERHTFDSGATPKPGEKARKPKALAQIDIEALGEQIKATVEAKKANDPAALRKQIADLQKQLAASKIPLQVKAVVPEVKIVEKPVLKDGQLARVEKIVASFNGQLANLQSELIELRKTIIPAFVTRDAPVGRGAVAERSQPAPPPIPRHPKPVPSGDTQIGKGERLILSAIAQHPNGVTREQLTVLTGYKRSSRDTYLQRLKAAGCIDQNGETITHTDAGMVALGDDYQPLPTGAELRRHWIERLSGGEQTLFVMIVEAYPNHISRNELSDRSGYQRSSRDTYLQRLSARKLITTTRDGVRASEELF